MEGKMIRRDPAAAVEARRRRKRDASDLLEFLEQRRLKLEEEEEARQPEREANAELLEALGRAFQEEDITVPVWLGHKRLTKTDVDPHHQRLFIPQSAIHKLKPHLNAMEKGEMEPADAPGISVSVIDPLGCRRDLKLKRWSSINQWALINGWQTLVNDSHLHQEDDLHIWAYRHGPTRQLAFLLQRIPPPPQ